MAATKTGRGRSNRRAPRHTQEERTAQWTALSERLAAWEGEADEGLIAAALAMHDGYSERNAMLIAMQDPQATDVRGYSMWQEVGRQVVAYPADEQGIAIVAFKGEAKAPEGEPQAEAAPAAEGADGAKGGDKKPSLRFSLATVHDIRRTEPIVCAECGRPIHKTGVDGPRRFPVWGHTGLADKDAGHTARKPRKGEDAPEAPAGSAEIAQAWHAARSAKAKGRTVAPADPGDALDAAMDAEGIEEDL
jgi:hypothetical protein